MRKQSLLVVAGAILAFTSCQNENTDTTADQAQIDSIVNARVDEMRVEMMMQNDSMINALAIYRADSIIAAMKGNTSMPARPSASRNAPAGRTTKPVAQPPQAPAKSPQDQKFEDRESGNRNISDEQKKKQDDKFNKRGG